MIHIKIQCDKCYTYIKEQEKILTLIKGEKEYHFCQKDCIVFFIKGGGLNE